MVTFQTTINTQPGGLARVHEMVSALERARGLPAGVVFDINVVLDEIISNILKYSYADACTHEIRIQLSATDTAVEIGIEDDGAPFDPLTAPEPDLRLPLAERALGGLGLHFVRQLMDEVKYKRENNRNYLFLNKKITPRATD